MKRLAKWLRYIDDKDFRAVVAIPAIAVLVALGIWGTLAYAQPAGVPGLYVTSPTGLEQINVLSTGPQIATITVNQIRNSTGYLAVPTGTTVTTNLTNAQSVVVATGTITTWNLNLPTAPADGQVMQVTCPGGNTGTLTIAATLPSGVAIVGTNPTSCTAATPTHAAFLYALSANTWYRID